MARWLFQRSVSGMTDPSVLQVAQKNKGVGHETLFEMLPVTILEWSTARLIVTQYFEEEARNAQVTISHCNSIGHHALSVRERICGARIRE
jgi:hypothetical protein